MIYMRSGNRPGYVAITSIIILTFIIIVIGSTSILTSISESQISLSDKREMQLTSMIDSCLEESLLRLNEENSLPSVINIENHSCTLTVEDHDEVSDQWIYLINLSFNGYEKNIRVIASRSDRVYILNWKEI